MIEALTIITKSYLLLLVLQVIFWPICKALFGKLPDEGWAMTRMVSVVAVSLLVWTLSHLGLPVNTEIGVTTAVLVGLLVSIWLCNRNGLKVFFIKKESVRVVVLAEYLFAAIFFLSVFVRGYLPNLDSLEKFMDYGFMVSYLNSPTLPAADMWQAGSTINYYSFGHFWASVFTRIVDQPAEIGYNIVLGFIAGTVASLTFVLSFAIGSLGKRVTLIGGLLAGLLMVFGGNSHSLWYLIKHSGLDGYWYADATRFIEYTIHEFPAYSLVVSDLHGHLLDLPVVILFLMTLFLFDKYFSKRYSIVLGILLGVMMMTNTWDVPIYGLLLAIYFAGKLISGSTRILELLMHGGIILVSMALVALPWWVGFEAISNGIVLVTKRSPLWQLVALWTLGVTINVVAAGLFSKTKSSALIYSMVATALLLIVIPELVYAKDIYPDHPRANTMFKLTYQSTVITAIVFGSVLTLALAEIARKFRWLMVFIVVALLGIFCGLMIFPTMAYPGFYSNFGTYYGLNGERWLEKDSSTKFEMLQYLKENKNGKNMVEAVGDSYTLKNVISAYSGIPTIQGWRVHEWLWRGGYDPVAKRETEVREIYESEDVEKSVKIIKRYNVGFIVVGLDETEQYAVNHQKLAKIGEVKSFDDGAYMVLVFP